MTQAEKLKNQLTDNKNQAPQKQKEKQTIYTLIEKMKPEIKRALPKHMDEDRMTRLLMTTVRKSPQLQQADSMSFLASCMEAAQIGLDPNTSLGHCYIIPYKNKQGQYMAEFQLGYKGILQLAHNTKEYKTIYAEPVYKNDEFHYQLGLNKDLHHVPADIPEGNPIYYYAVYHLKNGGYDFKVMSRAAIEAHAKKYSKSFSYSSSPWQKDFDGMALKTVILAVMKYAPKSIEVEKALSADSTTKTEIAEDMSEVIDIDYQEVTEVRESPEDYVANFQQQEEQQIPAE